MKEIFSRLLWILRGEKPFYNATYVYRGESLRTWIKKNAPERWDIYTNFLKEQKRQGRKFSEKEIRKYIDAQLATPKKESLRSKAEKLGVKKKDLSLFYQRIAHGWSLEDAARIPRLESGVCHKTGKRQWRK